MNDLWITLRKSFFAGLVVVVPLAASVAILWALFDWVTDFLLPRTLQNHTNAFLYRVIALTVFVFLVTAVGWVTRLVIGKRAVALAEKAVARVPLLNRIYGFLKEVSLTMLAGKKTMFQRVVLVELSRPGVYTLAFVTSENEGEAQAKTKKALLNVFVLASPPTHGYVMLVPREQVIELEMSVADAMKMVISGGAVTPPYLKKSELLADGN